MDNIRKIMDVVASLEHYSNPMTGETIIDDDEDIDNDDINPVPDIRYPHDQIVRQGLVGFFENVLLQYMRLSLCLINDPRCVNRVPQRFARWFVVPPCKREIHEKIDDAHASRKLSWDVRTWDESYNEHPGISKAEYQSILSRQINILCDTFDNDDEKYTKCREGYRDQNEIVREWSSFYDTHWKPRKCVNGKKQTIKQQQIDECTKAFKYVNDLENAPTNEGEASHLFKMLMCLMLPSNFMAFTRSCVSGLDTTSEDWRFSIRECVESDDCQDILRRMHRVIDWIIEETLGEETPQDATMTARPFVVDGTVYDSVFDVSTSHGVHFSVECDAQGRSGVSIHKILASLLCTPQDEKESVYNFINIGTGLIQTYRISQEVRDEIIQMFHMYRTKQEENEDIIENPVPKRIKI